MTLAVILSVCAFLCAPVFTPAAVQGQASAQDPSPAKPQSAAAESSDKGADPHAAHPATPTPSGQQAQPPAQTPAKKPNKKKNARNKKKAAAANCATTSGNNAPAPTTSGEKPSAGIEDPANCPPPVTVVHDGGTADPAIKLTGNAEAPQAKHPADQLVGTTEENLKKIEGRELNSSQQEMLTQIHQFLDQSKAATAAGDIDRGHNLAMKAHLLSDELTKQ